MARLGWRGQIGLVLAVALGLAAAGALVILSLGLALVLLPIVAIALFIGRWRLRKLMAESEREWQAEQRYESGHIIETGYAVVDDDDERR